MRSAVMVLVLLALLISNSATDARRRGEENWKQRYRKWKESEDTELRQGALIGTDEAAAARLYREEQNSVFDNPSEAQQHVSVHKEPSEDELWRQKIEEKLQRKEAKKKTEGKPASEITAWHEEKLRRQQEQHPSFELQRQKRHQPRAYSPKAEREANAQKPPPHTKVAEMARYIVHNSDWAAVAYTSRQPGTYGLPMADVFSISDGFDSNSTGIPYMYFSPKDTGVQDLSKDSRCSLAMTLAQGDYCKQEGLDPEDPRCAHVFLTGKIKTVKNGTDEWARAEKFFFDRHPHLRNMPKDHKFRFAKLKISNILLQDYFGGPASPTLAEYFAAKPEDFKSVQVRPVPEAEAEVLPGASSSDSVLWIKPVE